MEALVNCVLIKFFLSRSSNLIDTEEMTCQTVNLVLYKKLLLLILLFNECTFVNFVCVCECRF